MKKLLMGNEAIAYGALRAGVRVVTGYPGTPSTEVLQKIASLKKSGACDKVYVEWSVNEKAALEVAAGAAYAGARCLVTMKQVGLNVASDPLMSLAYVGVEGGLVVLVADDPGPISSQTEQDTRTFAKYSKLPIFDPSSPEEAYLMTADAFALSEKYSTPVLLRPTTRVCHANALVELLEDIPVPEPRGFVKDPSRWVIFPRLSYANHKKIEARNRALSSELSGYKYNFACGVGARGIITSGVSYAYAREALALLGTDAPVLKISTPHPFVRELAAKFLAPLSEVLVFEELDPMIENEIYHVCKEYGLTVNILGKLSGHVADAGENSVESALSLFSSFLSVPIPPAAIPHAPTVEAPALPTRPPTLCAGCPHRASFYAVKQAMRGKKALFAGDIGCYTLGNAMPLDMTDTCLCMGAGITVAQGVKRVEEDTVCFSFTGDSTFFHTGIVGIANAVYNNTKIVAVILDNSTTAMTGHQPNPSTGFSATGEVARKISIESVLSALGVEHIETVDPLDTVASVDAVRRAADAPGVAAVIFRSPCIALLHTHKSAVIDGEKCIKCKKCINELGCPAIVRNDGTVAIDPALCRGCGLCTGVCPAACISVL